MIGLAVFVTVDSPHSFVSASVGVECRLSSPNRNATRTSASSETSPRPG